MTSKEALKELEAYRRLCTHLDDDNDDYMLNGEYEEDNEVIETALKEYELMKQTKIITVNKDISNDDLEKFVHQRMFVDSSKQCGIKSLFDEEVISQKEAYEKWHKILDFEEELGIDLITLFKALKQKFVFHEENVKIEILGIHIKSNELYLYGFAEDTTYTIYLSLKEYGKTWALTREELEDEKEI